MKPSTLDTQSGLFCLVDNRAALLAAQRLADQADAGIRFCCEHREKLTVAEGRKRDEADSSRRAKYQQSMAELDQRMGAADRIDETMAAEHDNLTTDEIEEDPATDDYDSIDSFGATLVDDDDDDPDSLVFTEDYEEAFA
ncbi:MAG: hypothetical protein ACRBC3_08450 [Burkholderiaceae bacterium]